ncbi:MAG: adenylate kinase family protein [Phycisphaerae bacterium]
MRYKSILLFGAPGTGKGTQGKILGTIPGFFHSSTGDIFRSLDLQSEAGRKFWEFSSRGELVPAEFTIRVWRQYIQGMELINQYHPETEFLVLDGIPRNLEQAKLLDETIEVVRIVHLQSDQKKMVERLRRRALKEGRADDASDEVIGRRMEVYERETHPMLTFYPKRLIHEVDATLSQIRVLADIVAGLTPLKEALDVAAAERVEAIQSQAYGQADVRSHGKQQGRPTGTPAAADAPEPAAVK